MESVQLRESDSVTSFDSAVPSGRTVDRIQSKVLVGPDAQVDDKAVIVGPTDPRRTDPFLLLSEDWFSIPGFDWHPHRGLETVTMVLDGVLEHADNAGHAGLLEPGDVQWMTAGRGIIHRELAYRNEPVQTLQLWVNLPARSKMVETRYQDLRAADRPRVDGPGTTLDVISGSIDGVRGPALNHWPITACVGMLEPGATLHLDLPIHDRAFAYVLAGQVRVDNHDVNAGQLVWSEPVDQSSASSILEITATHLDQVSRVMVYSGRPIGERVAMGGPFVMNHGAEITQAFDDYRRGKFGPVPTQGRLTVTDHVSH
jgi:redox-sensitive bicupin YhaK (pirin superfamily)